jgi:peptidase C13-like protein
MAMSEGDTAASRIARAWRDFGRNVLSGTRLALFMRVAPEELRASWSQLVALVALGLAMTLAADVASTGLRGRFVAYGLSGSLFYVPLTLVAAWIVARIARREEQTLALAVALLALAVPMDILQSLYRGVYMHGSARWLQRVPYADALFYAWLGLAATVGGARMLGIRWRRRAAVLAVVVIVLCLPQMANWKGSIWVPRGDEDGASARSRYMALVSENAFYLQPKLLERELARLKPGRKGMVDLYFVGMAGYAGQDVFMKEVDSVSRLFRERFGTEGRTVRLVNNAKTVAEAPIASVTALRATLARLAQVMDRDEDVLFLYLTSHGSQDHHFSLDFWPLRFNTLDPATLRKLLDDSGIRRRVIVVSACYAGGFIDPLKDENSLVIAAAASDRNSFGCSNETDYTYFGKAYFDEALRETYSFVDAFEKAKPVIAEREKAQGFDGSDPQIFLGAKIGPALAAIEERLQGRASRAVPDAASAEPRVPPKYAEFVKLWLRPDLLQEYHTECVRSMNLGSPAYYVRKDPDYFGGLNERSRQWPRLMTAWDAYVEEYCGAFSNERLFEALYAESWRQNLPERDLDATLRFLRTDVGRHFTRGANQTAVEVNRRLVDASRSTTDAATRRYQEVQVRINAEFERERAAREKK